VHPNHSCIHRHQPDRPLVEGKTSADLLAFKAEYEKAVEEAGLDGYELRVQFPLFFNDIRDGRFVWDGSWTDIEEMGRITAWFEASEWPARFPKMMKCDSNSLWQVVDQATRRFSSKESRHEEIPVIQLYMGQTGVQQERGGRARPRELITTVVAAPTPSSPLTLPVTS
jgi:hypothetical protein